VNILRISLTARGAGAACRQSDGSPVRSIRRIWSLLAAFIAGRS
jgi:hypothetical protein